MSTTPPDERILDTSKRYSVKGWRGVAFHISGFPKRWEDYTALVIDEDGMEHEIETGEGEWIEQDEACGRVIVVMVGDDHKWEVDVEDLTPLASGDYCRDCGQIGCSANVIEED